MADITVKFPNLMGYDPKDRSRPVIIENAGGTNSVKTFNYLKRYSNHMNQALFGAGFAQNWIEWDRVPAFMDHAGSCGLKVEWAA
jgi:hypothetical protein